MLILLIILYSCGVALAWLVGLRVLEYDPYLVGVSILFSIFGGLVERPTAVRTGKSPPSTLGLAYMLPIIAGYAGVLWISALVFAGLMSRIAWLLLRYRNPVQNG